MPKMTAKAQPEDNIPAQNDRAEARPSLPQRPTPERRGGESARLADISPCQPIVVLAASRQPPCDPGARW